MNENSMKVFIVGCARSGTSLLRTMLNHHKDIFIPTESLFIIDYLRYGKRIPKNKSIKLILNEPQLKLWFNDYENIKRYSINDIVEIITLLHFLEMRKNNKIYWGEKTPRFIRSYRILNKYFEQIKFLIIIRDPRAVVNSFRKSNIHNSYLPHILKRWRTDINHGVSLQRWLPNDSFTIKYENLIKNSTETLKEICQFLNIEFDSNMLNYTNEGTDEYPSIISKTLKQLKNTPNKNRINAWKQELSNKKIRKIEERTADLMERYNYLLTNNGIKNINKNKVNLVLEYLHWMPVMWRYFVYRRKELLYVFKRKLLMSFYNKNFKPFVN
jgi:hypothetical protein